MRNSLRMAECANGEVGVVTESNGVMMDGADKIRHAYSSLGCSDILMASWRNDLFVNDLTGLTLPPELCKASRKRDIDDFKSKGAPDIWTLNEARGRPGRRPIFVRWVETSQGGANPIIRSHWVAREIRMAGEDAICAFTPPFESLRMRFRMATTSFTQNNAT